MITWDSPSNIFSKHNTQLKKISLILGLGNPGYKYQITRHNVGMMLCEFFAEELNLKFSTKKSFSWCESGYTSSGKNIVWAKTDKVFMNNSGLVLKDLITFFDKQPDEILIVHDELEARFGKYLLGSGSARGHNGIRSIFSETNTESFLRLKIGIGRPENKADVANYVLSNFNSSECEALQNLFALLTKFFCD